jgi:hypothetical protein
VDAPAIIIEVGRNVRLADVPATFIGSGDQFWLNETYDLDIAISAAAETTNVTTDNLVNATPQPFLAVLKANGVTGLVVSANSFPGALGVLHPSSNGKTSAICANRYGGGTAITEPACP